MIINVYVIKIKNYNKKYEKYRDGHEAVSGIFWWLSWLKKIVI